MNLLSEERRRERYMVLFIWKISQGMVHGYNLQFTITRGRHGRTALHHNDLGLADLCVFSIILKNVVIDFPECQK